MHKEKTTAGCIRLIKSELHGIYPDTEIQAFVFLIFEHLLDLSPTKLLADQDTKVSISIVNEIRNIISQLKMFRPIQYVLGETEFFGLRFKVKEGVLIPRPETEELVQWIIDECAENDKLIVDLGTGSGCIAVSLAVNLPNAIISAVDLYDKVLEIAVENAELNGADVNFSLFDILHPAEIFADKFDIIVSNPPYVKESEKAVMLSNVLDYEPESALFVPDDNALIFYRAIASFGCSQLAPGGRVFVEINEALANETMDIFSEMGYVEIEVRKDINGKHRMIRASL